MPIRNSVLMYRFEADFDGSEVLKVQAPDFQFSLLSIQVVNVLGKARHSENNPFRTLERLGLELQTDRLLRTLVDVLGDVAARPAKADSAVIGQTMTVDGTLISGPLSRSGEAEVAITVLTTVGDAAYQQLKAFSKDLKQLLTDASEATVNFLYVCQEHFGSFEQFRQAGVPTSMWIPLLSDLEVFKMLIEEPRLFEQLLESFGAYAAAQLEPQIVFKTAFQKILTSKAAKLIIDNNLSEPAECIKKLVEALPRSSRASRAL